MESIIPVTFLNRYSPKPSPKHPIRSKDAILFTKGGILQKWWLTEYLGASQLPATLLILRNLRNEELFMLQGWGVGASWILVTASYSLNWFAAVVVGVLGIFSPDEYTFIPNL